MYCKDNCHQISQYGPTSCALIKSIYSCWYTKMLLDIECTDLLNYDEKVPRHSDAQNFNDT